MTINIQVIFISLALWWTGDLYSASRPMTARIGPSPPCNPLERMSGLENELMFVTAIIFIYFSQLKHFVHDLQLHVGHSLMNNIFRWFLKKLKICVWKTIFSADIKGAVIMTSSGDVADSNKLNTEIWCHARFCSDPEPFTEESSELIFLNFWD